MLASGLQVADQEAFVYADRDGDGIYNFVPELSRDKRRIVPA